MHSQTQWLEYRPTEEEIRELYKEMEQDLEDLDRRQKREIELKAMLKVLHRLDDMAEGSPQRFFKAWIDLRYEVREEMQRLEIDF